MVESHTLLMLVSLSVLLLVVPRCFSNEASGAEPFVPEYRLPQQQYVPTPPNQGWETVTHSIRFDPPTAPSLDAPSLTKWYDSVSYTHLTLPTILRV